MDLTADQWTVLEPLIADMPRRSHGRGRPWRNSREVLDGILWIVRTGAQWADLPDRVPTVPDLPPPVPALGARWHAGARPRRPCPAPEGP
jgi:transposase